MKAKVKMAPLLQACIKTKRSVTISVTSANYKHVILQRLLGFRRGQHTVEVSGWGSVPLSKTCPQIQLLYSM